MIKLFARAVLFQLIYITLDKIKSAVQEIEYGEKIPLTPMRDVTVANSKNVSICLSNERCEFVNDVSIALRDEHVTIPSLEDANVVLSKFKLK
jgi:hypothetical protein